MPLSVKQGGTWRAAKLHVRQGGAWREVQKGFVHQDGAWRQFYQGADPLSVTPTPGTVSGRASSGQNAVTGSTTAEVTGGVGPFTYAWARVLGDTSITATDADGQSTAFVGPGGTTREATFRVTVTDTETGETATGTVDVTILDDFFSGGGGVQP